ncbi:GNAT family N-acetyltransferase [Azospirillum sp. B506]|uniref:GNAT family N-acetyltransferase n=1 Tax=Azospirillum sp. B506 TaxID=137721 RepID=UPI000A01F5BC|nr:GNAT family N-acetyltransferase [Azospirillum sp. B506]
MWSLWHTAKCQRCRSRRSLRGRRVSCRDSLRPSDLLGGGPGNRGLGIGRRLLTALETAAATTGCRGMRLEVRADNAAAIALYTAAGYRRFAIYPDYYEDGMAAFRLEKLLIHNE